MFGPFCVLFTTGRSFCTCLRFCILAYVGSYDSVMARDAKFAIYARSLAMYAYLGLPGASLSDEMKDWARSINRFVREAPRVAARVLGRRVQRVTTDPKANCVIYILPTSKALQPIGINHHESWTSTSVRPNRNCLSINDRTRVRGNVTTPLCLPLFTKRR